MPRIADYQPSFNAGELSPRLAARTDFTKYRSGLETLLNLIPLAEGGATRRAGSRFVAEEKSSSVMGRVIRFQFSTTQAYILELGERIMRFFRNQGQIVVADTDAAISNGTFDSDLTDWSDESTGSAAISWTRLGTVDMGTFSVAPSGATFAFGDASTTNRKHIGLRLTASADGDMVQVRVRTGTHTTNGDCVARIYTDSGGSPDSQVGGDSDTVEINAGTTTFTFTWSSNTPSLSDATVYWCIISNTDTALDTQLENVVDQGVDFGTGAHDTIGSMSDGSGSLSSGDLRIEVLVATDSALGVLSLDGASSETAIAEQDVATSDTGTEHVLRFRVAGVPGDTVTLRIGETSGGTQTLPDKSYGVGFHAVSFTPAASPFYVQFRNAQAKSIFIDDVSIIDDAPVELATPWSESELFVVNGPQSADVLYLCHSNHPVMKLSRRGHTDWSLEEVEFEDGPYFDTNTTATTLNPSATSGLGITITASARTGINGGDGFQASDVGRLVRILHSSTWGYAVITEVTSETQVTADVKRDFGANTAVSDWRLGAWSETTGYPEIGAFYEQRLFLAATTDQPQTFWASQTADFENMRPDSNASGGGVEVQDDDAFDFTLSADDVNAIRWMSAGENTLVIGTTGGEWVPNSEGASLTPDDITVRRQTTHGAAQVLPIRIDNAVLFLQRAKRKIREFSFAFEVDGFTAPDMTRLAYHITRGGITGMAYAPEPDSLVWAVRADGTLLSMTIRRDEDVVAWARHVLGGSFGSGSAVVESAAVIPGNDGDGQTQDSTARDEVWITVKRTIDGQTKRYVEFFERPFESHHDQEDAYYLDSLITYDGASTTSITGLDHLEGETVGVWADGAIQTDKTVSSGSITLDSAASVVQIGLRYTHRLKTLKIGDGNPAGTAVGKKKRIYGITFVLLDSHTISFGPALSNLESREFRVVSNPMDAGTPLFTGEQFFEFNGDWNKDARIVIESDDPSPFTLLGIAPELALNPLT